MFTHFQSTVHGMKPNKHRLSFWSQCIQIGSWCTIQYPADEILTLKFDVIFHLKINNVEIFYPNLDML
jgi:hypothetical protein